VDGGALMRSALLLLLLALAPPARAAAATLQELRRYSLAVEEGEDGRWGVTSPVGGALDSMTLAQVWYDRAGVRRLYRQDHAAWFLTGVQAAAGLALGAGALVAFTESNHYLPKRSGFSVSRRDYPQREDYLYAREQADLAYAAAMASVPEARRMRAENMAWTGFTLAFSATLVVGLAPAHRLRFQHVEREPDLLYARADAERRVEAWNAVHTDARIVRPSPPPVAWPHHLPGAGAAVRGLEAW
jgi:hypothetical protein